jgi:hypothetical protein
MFPDMFLEDKLILINLFRQAIFDNSCTLNLSGHITKTDIGKHDRTSMCAFYNVLAVSKFTDINLEAHDLSVALDENITALCSVFSKPTLTKLNLSDAGLICFYSEDFNSWT